VNSSGKELRNRAIICKLEPAFGLNLKTKLAGGGLLAEKFL